MRNSFSLLLATLLIYGVQGFVPSMPSITSRSPSELISRTSTKLESAVLGGGDARSSSSSLSTSGGRSSSSKTTNTVQISELKRAELRTAASVCIEAFFGGPDKLNPVKSMQLATLLDEQLADLKSRYGRGPRSLMLKALDDQGVMVGFVELSIQRGYKYGMGEGVPERDERPYLANLCVRPAYRNQGIGKLLVKQCEDVVQSWGYDELILQVEDTNELARTLYKDRGYVELWVDQTGRKYTLDGFSIKSVRINKISMRKGFANSASNPLAAMWSKLTGAMAA